jgi:hypothetical protein
MNRKQLLILLVLVVVLGALGWWLHQRQESSLHVTGSSMGQKLLGELPVNDVARITIKQGTNEVNLEKKADGWKVRERKDYPANYSEISEFLLKAKDLKIVQMETVGPSQLPKLSLASGEGNNAAEVVTLKDKGDKTIKSLMLGKKHMKKGGQPSQFGDMGDEGFPDGRYVKVGESDDVAVISEAFSNIEPKPDQWLNKDFLKIEKPKTISVTFPAATNSWKLTRETESGEWKLADAKPTEQLDASKASSVANPLSSATFNDVATQAKPEELGLDKPTIVSINTFDDLTYTLKVGAKTNENYALTVTVAAEPAKARTPGKDEKPEDKDKLDKEFKDKQKKTEEKVAQDKSFENWVYLVSNWTLDPLLKERSQLMVEKKEEPKKDGTPSTNAPAASLTPEPAAAAPAADTPPAAPAPAPKN